MFKIGEFSSLSNITVRSLRHYESIGLLIPEKTDPATGYRYYSAWQLETANKIRMLRDVGFSLESIKGLLTAGTLDAMRQYYELRQIELEEELHLLRRRKDAIAMLLNDIEDNRNVDGCNVVEKLIPAKTVLRTRKILPSYNHIKDFWLEFLSEMENAKVTLKEPLFLRSLCFDKEFKDTDVDVELHIEIAASGAINAPDRVITTPAVQAVTVTFNGGVCMEGSSFASMNGNHKGSGVYQSLARWIESNHYGLDGIRFNILHLLTKDGRMLTAPGLLNTDTIDMEHWINEWGFELTEKRE